MSRKACWLVAALCSVGFFSYGQVNLSSGLVAYYPFSGNFNDASGNANNGAAINGTTFGTDQWGNANSAAFFDGVNDYVNIAPSASLVAGKRFSLTFRFKTASSALQIPISKADFLPTAGVTGNVQYHIAMFAGAVVGNNGLMLGTAHGGNGICAPNGHPATGTHRTFGSVPLVNQWHCVVMTFDSGAKKVYLDGALVGQSTVTGFANNSSPDSCFGGAWRIGCWWQGDPRWFSGLMDDVRIYNRSLNSTEVAALCSFNPFATVVNNYAAVQSYDSCTNTFAVDDAMGFAAGDSVLMIQMKGAIVDSTNSSTFGNILQLGNAGNYEYNAVQSVNGNNIRLVNAMQRSYTIPSGRVQFVRVPHYATYTVNAPHTAAPWNGIKGGVFAISVAGTLTVDSSIDVSGMGFKGGVQVQYGTGVQNCGITTWSGPVAFNLTAQKGEGIAEVSASKMGGRARLANGGGAGNAHNAGGGGGSNLGAGGLGASEFNGCSASPTPSVTQGLGGLPMGYSTTLNKVFMGGGGGAAESNNFTASSGGAGGGIIVIRAGNVSSPGNGQLVATGLGAPECVASGPNNICHDGMGGGGGGGAVLVSAPGVAGALLTKTTGGKGADMSAAASYGQVGPGGGGGGGAVWFSGASLPVGITAQNGGGANGVISYNGSAWGATPGANGQTLTGLSLPIANVPFVAPCVNDTVINAYAAVFGYDSCTNTFTVDSTDNFFAGDTVIVIQMKGIGFDSTNTPSFGSVLAYNNAGNYEYNVVQSTTATTIRLQNNLLRTYTIPAGRVQLVKVPSVGNYTVGAPHVARAWNGVKGGVVAINVSNTLTLSQSIHANGKGFAGGEKLLFTTLGCNSTGYFYPPTVANQGAKKGEGPAVISLAKSCGRGALVSGGGGGNDHNSGGGGGSNCGGGGRGGFQHPWGVCGAPIINDIGGVGGLPLAYTNTANKIFLGGGGGAGHGNQQTETPGGAGGGLVLIRAGNIVAAGGNISANGAASPMCTTQGPGCNDDGGGGGGGGGAILISAASFTGIASVVANGGAGANTYTTPSPTNNHLGPGGGGGGGAVWTSGTVVPPTITTTVAGGQRGVMPQFGNDTFGSIPGSPGQVLAGLQMPISTVPFVAAPPVTIQDSILTCRTVLFTATGGGAGTPSWNFGNGASTTGTSVTYTYPAGGTYVASVQFPGCAGSDTETVALPSDPAVTVAGSSSVCAGASTPLTASGATSYTWTPTTGLNTSSGSTVVATPVATTTYIVTGTAATGCTDTAVHTLVVNPIPTVIANSSPSTICEGATTTLTAATSIPATFSWTPGGATQGIFQVSPVTTTVYTVTATAGGCSATDTVQVFVLPKPQVTISTPTPSVCPGGAATLNASVSSSGGLYAWAPPLSSTAANVTTPALTSPATFAVVYTAINGCKDTATQSIGISPTPVVAISGPALLCSGAGSATLTASGAASYMWSPGQYLNATTGASVQSAPPVGTSITYMVTGTNAAGCTDTALHTLAVEQSPTVSAGADTGFCSGASVRLNATGAVAYAWNPTNPSAAGDSIIVGGTTATTVTTAYIVTGTTGFCAGSDTVFVTARALPAVLASPKLSRVCLYDSTTLTATGAATYSWTPATGLAAPSAAVTRAKPAATTTYTVVGTDEWGCVNQDTLRVTVGEALPVRASGDGQPISCDNSLAQLHVTGATRYVWSPGQYLNDSTMAHPVATPPQTMQFTVIGYNDQGCSGRDTITVVSLKETKLAMPNIFTPNGDGLNDRVFPMVQCDFHFKQWSIYNRWGQRIYFSADDTKGWDGRFNGNLCDVGVYVFVVEGTGDAGNSKMLQGNITLTR